MNNNVELAIRVYIAEDNPDVAERLKLTIERSLGAIEIEIQLNHDLAKRALLRPHHYDVVILDLFRGNRKTRTK